MRIPVHNGDERPVEPEGQPSPPAGPGEPEGYVFSMEPARPAAPAEHDLYLRALADMANFRRRTEERAQQEIEEERRRLLNEFLSLADNLERALAHQDEPGLRQGLRLTREGLARFLAREGVEALEAAGRPFDPQVHEAVSTVANAAAAGQVVQEVQRGYRYHGRLLRPARVVVGRHE
jgi:molecular chaperone GrpE